MKLAKIVRSTVLGVGCVAASQSFAVGTITGELMTGKRWLDYNVSGVQAAEYAGGIRYSVPEFPLGIGGRLSLTDLKNTDFENQGFNEVDKAYIFDTSIEVMAWLPKTLADFGFFTPYVKLSHIVYSNAITEGTVDNSGTNTDLKDEGEFEGNQYGFGAMLAFNESWSGLVEYTIGNYDYKSKQTVNGVTGPKQKTDVKTRALLVGVGLGI